MKGKNLIILAGAVVILGAFIWFFERNQPTSDEARIQEGRVFSGLEAEAVINLAITNSHGAVSLRRHDAGWRLTEPIEADADPNVVNSALEALAGLKRRRVMSLDEVDAKVYGLDHPEATVVLTVSGDQKLTLEIGNATALGSDRAVTTDSKSVILTGGDFFSRIDKSVDDWRSRKVADIRLDQLAAITVRTENGTIETVNLGGDWTLHSPLDDRANREHLQNVISGLNGLRIEEFVDTGADLAAMGLLKPTTGIVLVKADGSSGLALDFGLVREHGGATQIACRRNATDIFWVNDAAATPLGMAPVLWRDPKVLSFDTWDVAALDLSNAGTSIEMIRDNGRWLMGAGTEVQQEEVEKRLSTLEDLTAIDFDLVNLGTPEMGRVVLTLRGSDAPITCTFFEPFQDGGNVLVSVTDRTTVMSVAPADPQLIFENLQAIRADEASGVESSKMEE